MNLLEDYTTDSDRDTAADTGAGRDARLTLENAVSDDAPQGHAITTIRAEDKPEDGARSIQKGHNAMNAIFMEARNESRIEAGLEANLREAEARNRGRMLPTGAANAQSREAALSRLLILLEAGATTEYTHEHADNALESGVELSQLARLRAAHASYALATDSKMRRLSEGAWVRERHA